MSLLQLLKKVLLLLKMVMFLLPKMAGNGAVEAAKITLLLLKMGDNSAVLAAKMTWLLPKMVLFLLTEMACYATAAAAKKGIAPVQIGAVAADRDGWGWQWHCYSC